MEESGEFGEGGVEQGGRGTFGAGDKSARGTDEEQMRRWHRGAGGGGQRGQELRPRRRPDFFYAPWISTPTPQVCLLYAAVSGGHVCICSAGDIIRDVVPLTAEGGLRGRGGAGSGAEGFSDSFIWNPRHKATGRRPAAASLFPLVNFALHVLSGGRFSRQRLPPAGAVYGRQRSRCSSGCGGSPPLLQSAKRKCSGITVWSLNA